MTPIAITFLILSFIVVWGGLAWSTVSLARRSEVAEYPTGGEDEVTETE